MRKTGVLLVVLVLILAGCLDKEDDIRLSESEFNGTFMRLAPGVDGVESPVNLVLNNGTYSGTADSLYYPAICEGTYNIEGNTITFYSDCGWTANFDWSYILKGTYIIEESQGETLFLQEVRENEFNVFRLD